LHNILLKINDIWEKDEEINKNVVPKKSVNADDNIADDLAARRKIIRLYFEN